MGVSRRLVWFGSFYQNSMCTLWEKVGRTLLFLLFDSEEEVQLREGGGETAGEARTASASAAGAQGEKSAGA